jgi:hypothetical protein
MSEQSISEWRQAGRQAAPTSWRHWQGGVWDCMLLAPALACDVSQGLRSIQAVTGQLNPMLLLYILLFRTGDSTDAAVITIPVISWLSLLRGVNGIHSISAE